MRPGGDARGSTRNRRQRKLWMLATFDTDLGPDKVRCHLKLTDRCKENPIDLTYFTVTADRIDPGGTYARPNVQPACAPCQNLQGALITRARREQWLQWMAEAEAEGIEWDGVM